MNIVDLIIIAILGFGLLSGMHKGSITSFASTIGFVGAWYAARAVYERIVTFALSNTTLMAVLNQYLEPEGFFGSHTQAVTAVSDVVAGAEASITAAVSALPQSFGAISTAFENNIRTQAFQNLGLTTLADYLDQTLWVAIFNVIAFVAAFILIYVVITLLINLLDRVFSIPVLRGVDWLFGGIFGLARASVVVVLVLTILPSITSIISPDLTESLKSGSALYTFASQIDVLNVAGTVKALIMG